MEHADVRIHAGLDERALNASVEDAVAIIEESIGHISGGMLATLAEPHSLGQKVVDGGEVDAGGLTFPATQSGCYVVDNLAL